MRLKAVFPSQHNLNTLFWFKDILNKKICSFRVYRYTCRNCNVTYYGKTYCHFFSRAVKHMGASSPTGKELKNIKDWAVSDHLLQCNCTINFDHFDVLPTDVCKLNLLVKGSLLIKPDSPVLNRKTKSFPFDWFD